MRNLKKEDALRIEYHITVSGRKVRVYIFECLDCGKELRPRVEGIKKYTGKCISCDHKFEKFKVRYNLLIHRSKSENIFCNLSFDDYLTFTKNNNCYYCDELIDWSTKTHTTGGKAYYIDRRDSSKGYILENCVVCCSQCNRMKMNLKDSDYIEKCVKIAKKWEHARR